MSRFLVPFLALLALVNVAPASAMDFGLLQTGSGQRLVVASGMIVPGDARKLGLALNQATRSRNGTKELLLDSPGGVVVEALAMADLMDQVGVSTVVPAGAICGSACASVLFVSGKYRHIDKGGVLAIHSCFDARDGEKMDLCDELIAEHAQYEGVPGGAMMALQEAAGTHAAFVFDNAGAACFGLTREAGATKSAKCLHAARHGSR